MSISRPTLVAATAALLLVTLSIVWAQAQDEMPPLPIDPARLAAMQAAQQAQAQQGPDPAAQFEQLVKDCQVEEGYLKLYHHPKGKAFLGIPGGALSQPFLLATSVTGGSRYTGWQWGDTMVVWQRQADKLLMVERNTRYRADSGDAVADVVRRTYSDRVIKAVPVMGERGGELLIDMVGLLAGGASTFFGMTGASLDASLAKFTKLKAFPGNVEIEVTMPARGDGMFTSLHYSLARIPQSAYQPRLADDRVGYFLTVIKDFTKGKAKDDRFMRYLNRWELKKRDPSLKLSPPVRPIVFYIEKTVPVRFRRYVKEGILEWNKAYEQFGYTEAIEVRQQTADNEFAGFDPEDARYNFFRWITSETPFAMGPSRVNPATGEILDADIIFDDSMVRGYLEDYNLLFRNVQVDTAHGADGTGELPQGAELRGHCGYGRGIAQELQLAGLAGITGMMDAPGGALDALARMEDEDADVEEEEEEQTDKSDDAQGDKSAKPEATKPEAAKIEPPKPAPKKPHHFEEFPESFIGPIVKEVVMHEVGHTLGLRHNFRGSVQRKLADINAHKQDLATSASVMDYCPINIAVPGQPQGPHVAGTLGAYDYLAIAYGYADNGDPAKIGASLAEKGLSYATDEDTMSADPYVNRWDLGADPLEYARVRLDLSKKLLPDIAEKVLVDGEDYALLRRAVDMLIWNSYFAGSLAVRFVGGEEFYRDHKGDPQARPPVILVDAAKQREALELLAHGIFAPDAFELPSALLLQLTVDYWRHWGMSEPEAQKPGTTGSYPVHERIGSIQNAILAGLLQGSRLTRLQDARLKAKEGQEVLGVDELFKELTQAILQEVVQIADGNTDVGIASFRQSLQRTYVEYLVQIGVTGASAPPAARAVAYLELKELREQLEGVLSYEGLDRVTQGHLREMLDRVVKALDAKVMIR